MPALILTTLIALSILSFAMCVLIVAVQFARYSSPRKLNLRGL